MADDTYQCDSGNRIFAGRVQFAHGALLDLIAAAPAASWVRVNTNRIDSQFPAADYRPLFNAGPGNPAKIMEAWSGFAWDSRNHRLIIFGGGHANYSGNDTYVWDGTTGLWQLAFYPSDVEAVPAGYRTVDGPASSPISSHTYGNNNYLPLLDRFVTFGGAAHSSGNSFVMTDGAGNALRALAGGYTLDLSQAGLGRVAGAPGSNVQRGSTVGVSLPGASAWYARDYLLDHGQAATAAGLVRHVNGGTAVVEEGGKDVCYVQGSAGGTSLGLYRIEYSDADDYLTDVITQVGQAWNNAGQDTGVAYDASNQIFVDLGDAAYPIYGWDISAGIAGPSNHNFRVAAADVGGPDAAEFLAIGIADFGLLHDETRGFFVAWERGGRLFSITPPSGHPVPVTGWSVAKIVDPVAPRPALMGELPVADRDTGVHGKFRRAPDLDTYVALQGCTAGDVWMYKPSDWTDPRTL